MQKRFIIWGILIAVCIGSFSFMWMSATSESAIVDEIAHIPAGYSYIDQFDYRLNPEHPPLLKALSGLTLLPLSPFLPLEYTSWGDGINDQWQFGVMFFVYNGEDIEDILLFARLIPMLFMIGLVILTFLLSRRIIKEAWALFPAIAVALSPHFIAHGHYVTTDVPLAFGILLFLFFFITYIQTPSPRYLVYSGIALGVALLIKFSSLLLLPVVFFGGIIYMYASKKTWGACIGWAVSFLKMLGIAFIIIFIIYGLFTINTPPEKQALDTSFLLTRYLQEAPDSVWGCFSSPLSCVADGTQRIADIPLLRGIAQYTTGVLMVLERSSYGNPVYFLGEVGSGWWYYFPVVYFFKEPLGLLLIVLWGGILAVRRMFQRKKNAFSQYISLHTTEFFLLLFVISYLVMSMKSSLNIGFRHILPLLPPLYILAFGSIYRGHRRKTIQKYFFKLSEMISHALKRFSFLREHKKEIIIVFLLFLVGYGTFYTSPYFLSYFNEIGGGTWEGWRRVVDSNYDWGQDLPQLVSFVQKHDIDRIAVDYFGGALPSQYLGDRYVRWTFEDSSPRKEGIEWFAVSIQNLQLYGYGRDGYKWLDKNQYPYARAGTSIFIYRLLP